jgi:RND family efflux transporter MFP subunit
VRNFTSLAISAALVLGVVAAVAAFRLKAHDVVVTPVVRGRAVDAVYATGTVEAEDRVSIKAKINGTITELFTREGRQVRRGDLLARIDNPTVSFDLKRGRADQSAATAHAAGNPPQIEALQAESQAIAAELDNARAEVARLERLLASGSIAQSELDHAHVQAARLAGVLAANEAQQRSLRIDLHANVARQNANVEALAARLGDTDVRAPIDGVVLDKKVELGEVVAINQPLFRVGDTSHLILEVLVDEADVARVAAGPTGASGSGSVAAVTLYAFPKQVFSGRVYELQPDADRARKTFVAKVRLDAPPRGLRSGMSAETNIITQVHDGALLAPTEAIDEQAVWIVKGARAEHRTISIGLRDLLRVEVLEGLRKDDLLVVAGQEGLTPNARVAISMRAPDKLEPLPNLTQPAQNAVH